MSLHRRSLIIIAGVLTLLVIAGAVYYFFFRTEKIVFDSYVCEDGSYYFVLQDKKAIEVAGRRYELVSDTDGMRYENAGPIVYIVRGEEIQVLLKESGETVASCSRGKIESAPIIDVTP